jgi:dienelactone hydrolase
VAALGPGRPLQLSSEALALAERGAASILVNAPFRRAGALPGKTPQSELKEWLQAAVDIRRAADVLLSRYGVPPARLAYVGHSYGATLGGVIAAGEPRFRSLVLMGGVATMSGPLSAIDAERFIGQAAPGSVLLQFARYDRFVTEEQAQRYADAAGKAATVRWYECGHEFNDAQSTKERAEWLARRLDLAGATYVARR